jgi:hypothetical protein
VVGRWAETRGSALLAAISSCSTDGFSNNFPYLLRLPAMSFIAHRSQWVRCSNRHCRATVRFEDSRCARCGSGQSAQAPIPARARLRHCANNACRAFILDSDTRCSHCGCEAPAFKAFRFGVAVMGRMAKMGFAVGILLLLVIWALRINPAPEGPEPGFGNPSKATAPRSPSSPAAE